MRIIVVILGLMLSAACGDKTAAPKAQTTKEVVPPEQIAEIQRLEEANKEPAVFVLTSEIFADGEAIPSMFTGDGEDLSPPLRWSGTPKGAVELAIMVDDPDAPGGKPFVHWLLWGIQPEMTWFTEGVPPTPRTGFNNRLHQGMNDFGTVGWRGPAPPAGKTHNYRFRIYALSERLELQVNSKSEKFLAAIEGKVLAKAELTGTYKR